jgi:hypothetical protein
MATQQWGRNESIIFPPHSPIYSYGAVFLAFILTGCFFYARFDLGQTPLQQFYTPIYARAATGGALKKKNKFQLLYVGSGVAAGQLATEADVQAGTTAALAGKHIPLALSRAAAARGLRALYRGPEQVYVDAPLTQYLKSAVFEDESLWDIYKLPLLFGFLSLLIQLPFSIAKDITRRKQMKYGRLLKGPVMLTPKEFNKTVQGDGIGFKTTEAKEMMRITEIPDNARRIEAIAKDYAAKPENTLVVSPDNASRRDINDAIRTELKASGAVSKDDHRIEVLTQRSELTSADRTWAAKYQPDDILYYTRGSKEQGIEPRSYATVVSIDAAANQITVAKEDGKQVSYDPERLRGISAYREISRDFAEGDRIQFTATNRELGVSNRDLGAIQRIDGTQIEVKMDGEKERNVSFDSSKMRHFDHGYAVTSHSSQGLTTDRVLVNMDTTVHPELINTRFAYVSISRASQDARIYTNDTGNLGERLSTEVTKTSAIDLQKAPVEPTANQQTKEPPMTNSREHPQDDLRRETPTQTMVSLPDIIRHEAEVDTRHYAPIEAALPNETQGYEWKRETGDIESYKHDQTGGWLHIDTESQFYDRQAQPITRECALEYAANPLGQYLMNAGVSDKPSQNTEQGMGI